MKTLNHFFEGATVGGAQIENELMLVRCSQESGSTAPAVVLARDARAGSRPGTSGRPIVAGR